MIQHFPPHGLAYTRLFRPFLSVGFFLSEMIDGGASGGRQCNVIPQEFWVAVIALTAFVLIFMFSFRFRKDRKIRGGWEFIVVAAILAGWLVLDNCRHHSWFPIAVLISSVVIYLSYLHERIRHPRDPDNSR